MMCFIHIDKIKLNFLQQLHRIRDSNETFGIEVNPLVVASAHFAETREVWSKLVQQGSQGNRDQDLRMAQKCHTEGSL